VGYAPRWSGRSGDPDERTGSAHRQQPDGAPRGDPAQRLPLRRYPRIAHLPRRALPGTGAAHHRGRVPAGDRVSPAASEPGGHACLSSTSPGHGVAPPGRRYRRGDSIEGDEQLVPTRQPYPHHGGSRMVETRNETAIFGGGCFWCTEAAFDELRGVLEVEPGYAGGTTPNPTYEQV